MTVDSGRQAPRSWRLNQGRQPSGCRPFALLIFLLPLVVAADEFGALPGLWKTTYHVIGSGEASAASDDPPVNWHCVDEIDDPWKSFAQLHQVPGMTCSATSQERTATSLRWKYECRGPVAPWPVNTVTSEGSVVFDAPNHYTGKISVSGQILGLPVRTSIEVEGKRVAACTSPRD